MCVISFALVAAASTMDRHVAEWVRHLQIKPSYMKSFVVDAVKTLGVYWTTAALAILVAWRHRLRWRASIFILMTGLVCLLGNLLKWMIGRTRPFKLEPRISDAVPFELQPFRSGWEGLFAQKNLAFPSGHTMVAFATAAGLAILWPRWRWCFYAAATLVAAERVLENAHWLSDVVGAAGLAICGVYLMWRIILPWVTAPPGIKNEPQTAANLSQP
ncbi:MAG TPA: phosphatase PAP2 family protein [Tepidisphaeraceae bacterium]|jgi:undecaprenyl-diphosphatase|nr:phosphatase PAP2 family protein [Tepidisphaeraceae bacterium]